jgi:hypothetical protein
MVKPNLCVIAVAFAAFSTIAAAQTAEPQTSETQPQDQAPTVQKPAAKKPFVAKHGAGVYQNFGNKTYTPDGSLQFNKGGTTVTQTPEGPGPTYSTYGNQTWGTDGSWSITHGNRTHENDGTLSEARRSGRDTYIYKPGGSTMVCSTYGHQVLCR